MSAASNLRGIWQKIENINLSLKKECLLKENPWENLKHPDREYLEQFENSDHKHEHNVKCVCRSSKKIKNMVSGIYSLIYVEHMHMYECCGRVRSAIREQNIFYLNS